MPGLKEHSEAKKENGDYSDELVVLIFSVGSKGSLRIGVQWIPFCWSNLGGVRYC